MKRLSLTTQKIRATAVPWGRKIALLALLALSGPALAADDKAFVREYDSEHIQWGPCPAFMPDSCGLAVLQGDPKKKNTDVLFRLRSNTTAPHHWHTSAERMVLLSGEMMVDYDNQEPVVIEPGNYAYGPPELPHVATCQSQEDCVLFIAFNEPVDAFAVDE
ncbi:cupin domain-containing protein [Halomonas sp. TRM85114]|uniref:cupin domain-containing protein n=1 Tax=Halomonas jincaotanensis TaxID=2810616 RepID=UPI001BD5CE05|nr:cupin domain-containing protein [Halomonas jincaotanensis]MBS9404579.1 cupin domain-containing protein [Halomonas jincaotanensis]